MQKKDIGLGAVSMALGVVIWFMAMKLKAGAAFWPEIVAGAIIVLGAIILVKAILETRKKKPEDDKKGKAQIQYLQVIEIVAALLIYYFAFQYIGYTIPTFLLICVSSYILGYRNWKVMIIASLLVSVGLYVVFTYLFGIHFPGVFF